MGEMTLEEFKELMEKASRTFLHRNEVEYLIQSFRDSRTQRDALRERVEKAEGEIDLANELDETLGLGDSQLPLAEIRSLHDVMEERDTLRIENGILRQKLEKAEEDLRNTALFAESCVNEANKFERDLAALRLREARLVALLKEIEWEGEPVKDYDNKAYPGGVEWTTCPSCCEEQRKGHDRDCPLKAALDGEKPGEA